jgi:hypothetical protein
VQEKVITRSQEEALAMIQVGTWLAAALQQQSARLQQ